MSEYEFGKSISTGESFKFDKSEGLNRIRVDLIWRGEADLDVSRSLSVTMDFSTTVRISSSTTQNIGGSRRLRRMSQKAK